MSCITLLSDLGPQDSSVAIARGILLQHTTLPIIDISHEVTQFHTSQAAYLLGTSYGRFPAGTVHIPLFNIFYDTPPRLILCEHGGHFFLCPDNGLITMALGTVPPARLCIEMTKKDTFGTWLQQAGAVAGRLQQQGAAATGLPSYQLKNIALRQPPQAIENGLSLEVIHIDQYGNAVLNITRDQFDAARSGRSFRLQFMLVEELNEISSGYYQVREGFKLCRFNSSGYLEICINRGSAASLFGLRPGSELNDIKILFE